MILIGKVKWADRLYAKAVQCSSSFEGTLGNEDGRSDIVVGSSGLSYTALVCVQMKWQESSSSK